MTVKKYAFSTSVCLLALSFLLSACQRQESPNREGVSISADETSISVTDVVVREMPPTGDVAVAYLRFENLSEQDRVLNYVHSPVADRIEVHRHVYQDGMMKMRQVQNLNVAASSALVFEPTGYHLMLFGVAERLLAGQTFDVTFEFEQLAPITAIANVKRL